MGDPNTGIEHNESNLGNSASGSSSAYLGLSMPGFDTVSNYEHKLASGDPGLVSQAIEPQASQIEQQYAGAVQSAKHELSRGGGMGDVTGQLENQRAGQVASLRAGAVSGAYPALAQLASQTGALSVDQVANALNAFGAVGQQQGQAKANTMGLIGGLAGDATSLGVAGA